MATYLVTGAAGFIGSKVSELLVNEGNVVFGVDNMNNSYDVRLKEWRLSRLREKDNFIFKRADISKKSKVEALFSEAGGFDAVINLAARAGVRQSVKDPWVYYETNILGTLNLLEMCRIYKVGKFILSSTSSVYGKQAKEPYGENAVTDFPLSPYAASKKGAEVLCYTYHYLYGIDVTVFRYFTVYGPAGRPDMSPFRFVQWIVEERPVILYGDGSQSRDFTYIDDVALGTIKGLKPVGYEVINLGSDKPIPIIDMIKIIEDLTGKKAKLEKFPFHPADVPSTWADIEKAKRLLSWEPRKPFREGMRDLVSWYMENRSWAKDIDTGV